MSFYVYCLSDESAPGAHLEGVEGVGGAPTRVARAGRLSAVVSEYVGERVQVTREHLRAHNAVLAHVLAQVTPLPFRFGTLADESRLRAYVEKNESALAAQLARVRGAVEMSVKVLRGAHARGVRGAAVAEVVPGAEDGGRAEDVAGVGGGGQGAAFLEAKRREMEGGERLKAQAEEVAAWLAGTLDGLSRESRVSLSPAESLFLSAAHLVERKDLDEYRARVRAAGAARGADLRFLTSGPWPPYSFCEARAANLFSERAV